ncbi:MAG TPA: VOC family protein [Acidimicrobiales bacterium]|nr:VOC family protein [Acidimicrobiales bacterium]
MTTVRLGSVSLDCADPFTLASFWANLLGGDIVYTSDDFVAVNVGGAWISTLRVANYVPPQWPSENPPKQMHLDLAVDDLDSSELFAIQLGAVKTELQPQPERWRVMLDPVGHPFCLTTQIPE